MKSSAIVEASFSGSHTVAGHPVCGELHGHTWRVRVEIAANEKDLDGSALATAFDVERVLRDFHRRDLNRFLPGVETSASGLALYFRERLGGFPITAIEVVTDDGFGMRVVFEPR